MSNPNMKTIKVGVKKTGGKEKVYSGENQSFANKDAIKPILVDENDHIILGFINRRPTLSFFSFALKANIKFYPAYYIVRNNISTDVAKAVIFKDQDDIVCRIQFFYHPSLDMFPSTLEFEAVERQLKSIFLNFNKEKP
jgi:hypothetical protein